MHAFHHFSIHHQQQALTLQTSEEFMSPTDFTPKLRKFDGAGCRVWTSQLQLYLEGKQVRRSIAQPAPTSL